MVAGMLLAGDLGDQLEQGVLLGVGCMRCGLLAGEWWRRPIAATWRRSSLPVEV